MSILMTKEFPDCFTLSNLIKEPKSSGNKPQVCTVRRPIVASIKLSLKKCT